MYAPMDNARPTPWEGLRTTMNNFRVAVLLTIAFLALLMVTVALAAVIFEVSDKGMAVVGIVLAALPTLITSLLVYLKIDDVSSKADAAARRSAAAAIRAASVEQKVQDVHHDLLNGGLRENVKRAISEDRHALKSREAAQQAREQMEARVAERRRHLGLPDEPLP